MSAHRALVVLAVSLAAASCGRPPPSTILHVDAARAEPGTTYRWRFDPAPQANPASPSPIESGAAHDRFAAILGRWRVERDDTAPSAPHVLRQERAYAAGESPRIVVDHLLFADLRLSLRCRVEPGIEAGTCGAIVRTTTQDDFVVARLDVLSHRVVVERVRHGIASEIASAPSPVRASEWHRLEVTVHGALLELRVDDAHALRTSLSPLDVPIADADAAPREGLVGLFTKGDGVASFDDLEVEALAARP